MSEKQQVQQRWLSAVDEVIQVTLQQICVCLAQDEQLQLAKKGLTHTTFKGGQSLTPKHAQQQQVYGGPCDSGMKRKGTLRGSHYRG